MQEIGVRALRLEIGNILDPAVSEKFMSEPNPGLQKSRREPVVTGATLGGSSAINGAVFSIPSLKVRPLLPLNELSRCAISSSCCPFHTSVRLASCVVRHCFNIPCSPGFNFRHLRMTAYWMTTRVH